MSVQAEAAAWVRRATCEWPMKHRRLFLLLTLPILVSDLLFVGINQYASQRTLRLSLQSYNFV